MSRLEVLTVSDNKEEWLSSLQSVYLKKINHFLKFSVTSIKPYREARGQTQDKILKEGESLLKKLDTKDYVIVCDENGKIYSSVQFSKKMEKLLEQSASRKIVFVIGGAYGLSDEVKKRAQETMQLSTLVMNHHLAQAVLLEQLYRALTIIKRIPYHNE